MNGTGGVGKMDRTGGEGFCEGFVKSTGLGLEEWAGLCITCNGRGYSWWKGLQ